MKGKILFLRSFAFSALVFTYACNGNNENNTNELNTVELDTSDNEIINDEFAELFASEQPDYYLPSPLQVASIFKKSGLNFNANVINKVSIADDYTGKTNQMLNFGVYSADMAYCVLNEQPNEGRKCLDAITTLADKIGMEAVFENQDLMDRFDKNMDNKDSIELLMIDIHERTENYMDENDMKHQQAIHFAGAWTEGMYLGVYDYENNGQRQGLGSKITEQMSILDNILKGLRDPKNNGIDLEWIINDLESIKATFNSFESVNNYFDDPEADEILLEDAEYEELGELIKQLRIKITEV